MSNSFDPNMLDMIIENGDETTEEVYEIKKQIEEDKNHIEKTGNVNVDKVYSELSELIALGSNVLKSAKYAVDMDPTAEGVLAGTASMMNAVKDTVKEFTKIHLQNIKFQQQVELEKIKQKGREKLIELRNQGKEVDGEVIDTTPFCVEDIIEELNSYEKNQENGLANPLNEP